MSVKPTEKVKSDLMDGSISKCVTSEADILKNLNTISVSSIPVIKPDKEDDLLVKKINTDVFVNKRNIYLSGPGGTGKSFLLVNTIKRIANERGIKVGITSTTGVSALSIGGTTTHRWTGIKLGKEALLTITERIRRYNKECYAQWRECQILIIDEVSMLGMKTFELIDRVGRNIREIDLPFGGMQVIFSGDFLQLPPIADEFAFKSEVWDELNIKCYRLNKPRRYPDEKHFEMLQRCRLGKLLPSDIKTLYSRADAYIKYIGDGMERKEQIKPTRIFSFKKDVEKHNMDELTKLPGDAIAFNSIDKFKIKGQPELKDRIDSMISSGKKKGKEEQLSSKDILDYTEFLNTVVPKQLFFKPGAQVMLTYNLSPDIGLVNGSRGVSKSIEQDGITVLFKNGITTKIVYHEFEFEDGKVKMTRFQLPLMLSWANSIHKSQGATLDYAIIDLGSSIFCDGMAYVALSRVRTLDGLLLSGFIPKKITANQEALDFEEIMEANECAENETFDHKIGTEGDDEVKVEYETDSETEENKAENKDEKEAHEESEYEEIEVEVTDSETESNEIDVE